MTDRIEPKSVRAFDHESMPWPKTEKRKDPEVSGAVDRASADAVRGYALHATASRSVALDDRVLYVGMNPASEAVEVAALRGAGADVTQIAHSEPRSIGLDGSQAEAVARILAGAPKGSRDELASIAKVWAAAERGGTAPSRLVLSGHSAGSSIYYKDDSLRFDDLRKLAAAMPRGAAHVEDLHLSGCNTGLAAMSTTEREAWVRVFPNLQTLWGYQGSCAMAPGEDLRAWEQKTRGRASVIALDGNGPVVVANRFGRLDGAAAHRPLAEVLADAKEADALFPSLCAGNIPVDGEGNADNPYLPLYKSYQAYQLARAREDVPAADRAAYHSKADALLRLRCYESVRKHFVDQNESTLRAGFAAAHLPYQDFKTLDRAGAVAAIDGVLASTTGETRDLLRAFAALDPNVLPEEWCEHE